MIKYECKDGEIKTLKAQGDISILGADTLLLLRTVYREAINDNAGKKLFKEAVREMINDDRFFDGEFEKKEPELSYESAVKALNEVSNDLDEDSYNALYSLLEFIHKLEAD